MSKAFDVAVIGAGPAGLAAAATADELGLNVVVLDEQASPGGQIYKNIERVADRCPDLLEVLGPDYAEGMQLVASFRRSSVIFISEALVWNVSDGCRIDYSQAGRSHRIEAKHIIIATGAYERPVPIPGWTLPGVTTAGALQVLLKTSAIVPDKPVVLAGGGPLLLLIAVQLTRAGAPPAAVVETAGWDRYLAAIRHLTGALRSGSYLAKGIEFQRVLHRAGVPVHRGATSLEITGTDKASGLRFRARGRAHEIECDMVALHQGVVPNPQLARLTGCEFRWNAPQACFVPVLDDWFRSSNPNVSIAGDGAGIGGAKAAIYRGRIAALGTAAQLDRLNEDERDERAAPERSALRRDGSVRPLLETLYCPPEGFSDPGDDVVVCRCEEVTAGALRQVARLGAMGPNQAKTFLRCGMGPCQGRLCGLTVSNIMSRVHNAPLDETGYFRVRPPIKPLRLQELVSFDLDER